MKIACTDFLRVVGLRDSFSFLMRTAKKLFLQSNIAPYTKTPHFEVAVCPQPRTLLRDCDNPFGACSETMQAAGFALSQT